MYNIHLLVAAPPPLSEVVILKANKIWTAPLEHYLKVPTTKNPPFGFQVSNGADRKI